MSIGVVLGVVLGVVSEAVCKVLRNMNTCYALHGEHIGWQ